MGVAEHLHIQLEQYDARIRTFVPHYEHMLATIAAAVAHLPLAPVLVDLGVGTGALADHCLTRRPDARLVAVDNDPAMLEAARGRLARHGAVKWVQGNFLDVQLEPCDAIVACISLHHVPSPTEKQALFHRCHAALRPGGTLVSGDCYPARNARLARDQREAWLRHLEISYSRGEADGYLEAWAAEDVYFPLADELTWLADAGFQPEVLWRADGFAVIAGERGRFHAPPALPEQVTHPGPS
jgi:tRNA (cmo5U34)-methyltransferase